MEKKKNEGHYMALYLKNNSDENIKNNIYKNLFH